MLEKAYKFTISDEKIIEKIVDDNNAAINHVVLPKGTGLPEHYSNSNVYLIILRGSVTIKLNEKVSETYRDGDILSIPYNTKMNIENSGDDVLELFIVKSPNPNNYTDK